MSGRVSKYEISLKKKQRRPRFSFVFTPFHGSWLNQIEIWFSILTAQCRRGRSFHSVTVLANAIRRYAKRWNEELAKSFNWTYTGRVLHA